MAFVVVVVVVNFLGVKLLISGRKGIRLRHCLCFIATLFQTSTVPVLGPVTKETLISSEYEYEIEYNFKISEPAMMCYVTILSICVLDLTQQHVI